MIFSCERPYAFYGLFILIPLALIEFNKFRDIISHSKKFALINTNLPEAKRMKNIKRTLVLRSLFRNLAWVMIVFAFAGFSWGTYEVPVQKSGSAVSFVFDISYSMTADDSPGGLTRLTAASRYADLLLSKMEGSSVSVVLAKGDGVVVVPVTEDTLIVKSLLETLSPNLMSATGTSLGKGILAALQSFPRDSSQAQRIWVFTDGDETDNQMTSALESCVKSGVNVSLIGFGTEREIEITTGDGKTKVMTALRSDKMKKSAAQASKYAIGYNSKARVQYIDATQVGSAIELLKPLKVDEENAITVAYEVRPVERYTLFLILAIISFVLSFFVAEFDFESYKKILHKTQTVSALFCISFFLFTSCTSRISNSKEILVSSWAWYQKKYRSAIAGFLRVEEEAKKTSDKLSEQYAQYNLGATYIMQNEFDAALSCLENVSPSSSEQIKYAAYYNKGIIAYHNGDYKEAVNCFREALKVNGSKIEAKENLEIARQRQVVKNTREQEVELLPITQDTEETSSIENAVYNRIRENDKKQWKNSEQTTQTNSSLDY